MASKHFTKRKSPSTLSFSITLGLWEGKTGESPHPVPPTTCHDHIGLHDAYLGVANGVAALLASENGGGKRALSKLFTQSQPQVLGNGIRVDVLIPESEKRQRPFSVRKTWELLNSSCSAEALSSVGETDPSKAALLAINRSIHENAVEVRVEYNGNIVDLRNLGLADHTYPGQDWQDEILLVLTAVDYRLQMISAVSADKLKVQLALRLDHQIFEQLRTLGAVHIRLWGMGFSKDNFLRILNIYAYEEISGDEFQRGTCSYQD